MVTRTRAALLVLATLLLIAAAYLAARASIPGALGLLALATLAATFERLLAMEKPE